MDEIDRIINVLDFEIDRRRSESHRPGWTKWALIGGIGTCGWLFFSELVDKTVSWSNVAVVFLGTSIVWDVFEFLIPRFRTSEKSPSSETRVILSKSLLGGIRFNVLFELIRVCVLLVMGSTVLSGGFVLLCFQLWYGTFAVIFLFGVLIFLSNSRYQLGGLRRICLPLFCFLCFLVAVWQESLELHKDLVYCIPCQVCMNGVLRC
jgi:hypothetical protein